MGALLPRSKPPANGEMPPYWIFYPALLFSLLVPLILKQGGVSLLGGILLVVLALLPLAGICFRVFGHRTSAAVCAVIVIALYLLPLVLSLVTGLATGGEALIFLVYYGFIIVPLGAFGMAATASVSRHLGPRWAKTALVLSLGASLVVGFMAGQASYVRHHRGPGPADPFILKDDFLTLNKCLQEFAVAAPRTGFPASLTQLGSEGNGCVSEELAKGTKGPFTIHYKPGPRSDSGVVESFSLAAVETAPKAKSRGTMYTDEGGLIWFGYEDLSGKGHPELIYYPGVEFNVAQNCAWQAGGTQLRIYDDNREQTTTDRVAFARYCMVGANWEKPGPLNVSGYNYDFKLSERSGQVAGFELNVRPEKYGITALRSYLAIGSFTDDGKRQHLVVHATPQNRAATEQDTLASPRELYMPLTMSAADQTW